MKRTILVMLLIFPCLLAAAGGDKFFASAGASLLVPADGNFSDLYGKTQVCPELRLGYALYRNFYAWLGGGFLAASGRLPVLEDEIKASQTFLSLGLGWETRGKGRLQADVAAGLLMAGLREEAMGTARSKWAPGFDARAGVRYYLNQSKKFFLGLSLGYAAAWAEVETGSGLRDVTMGGARLAGLLGIRF